MLMIMTPEARRQGVTLCRLECEPRIASKPSVTAASGSCALKSAVNVGQEATAKHPGLTVSGLTVYRAVSHEGVTTDAVVGNSIGVCDVLGIGGDNLVAVVTDLVRLGFAVPGDERCEVEAFRALLSVVDDSHAVVGVRLNVRQEREEYTLVVLRAVVEDGEHVSVSCVGR